MSSAHIFYPSVKTFDHNSKAGTEERLIVPLEDLRIWVGYTDGAWLIFNSKESHDKNGVVKTGQVSEKGSSSIDVFKAPKLINKDTIVFVNLAEHKLQSLNLNTGKIDESWQGVAPTNEALSKQAHGTDKGERTYQSIQLEAFKDSNQVVLFERKAEDNEKNYNYLISIFNKDSKDREAQFTHNATGFTRLVKANNKDKVVIWPLQQAGKLQFWLLDISKTGKDSKGLQLVSLTQKLNFTIVSAFPWKDNTLMLFANPDNHAVPLKITHELDKVIEVTKTDFEPIYCNSQNQRSNVLDVLSVDSETNRVLLKETSGFTSIVVWDAQANKVQYSRPQDYNNETACSNSGSYFVEWKRVSAQEKTRTRIVVNKLVSRKILILHILMNSKFESKTSGRTVKFSELHADAFTLKLIADALVGV